MITFENVSKLYPGSARPALDQVSFHIDPGEFAFLIGPSGSGKTSILKLLVCETTVDSGDIYLEDLHVNRLRGSRVNRLRRHIGYVFQDFRLLPRLSVYDNVAFALEVIGAPRSRVRQAVPEALELVGLETKAHRFPQELSGGEQQRVAVARAFVNRPPVVLADEPTGNLDPGSAADVIAVLERIQRTGTTVLMSTHNARAVNDMRQRVLELRAGVLVRDEARGVYGEAV
ncbi:cell division ATP-binding protein FtsE [Corynebacterium lizhenjunii]|uniref:Cell division ATP-binding protein FtsE n=1 Tax=Corynebacterium lizhenjunii TaxID=2709394 RepID=A0A7T0KFN0_9CORY|nr:cell division ATP-binding protein FtsE [Corynebacterium lizhenjunii]QPK79732.1 cell division ATP-binding protein FtsE [Corynebacterium lizhenjunii]